MAKAKAKAMAKAKAKATANVLDASLTFVFGHMKKECIKLRRKTREENRRRGIDIVLDDGNDEDESKGRN